MPHMSIDPQKIVERYRESGMFPLFGDFYDFEEEAVCPLMMLYLGPDTDLEGPENDNLIDEMYEFVEDTFSLSRYEAEIVVMAIDGRTQDEVINWSKEWDVGLTQKRVRELQRQGKAIRRAVSEAAPLLRGESSDAE